MDEVDEILTAWQRERPDLDVGPLAVLSRVDRLAAALGERRRRVFGDHGLAGHEFDVLAALRRAGPPFDATVGDLVRATHVTSGTMTHRLDGLVRRRLVRRRADPADGRVVRVRLTATGRARVDAALTDLLAAERDLLTGLGATRQRAVADALRAVLERLDPAARQAESVGRRR